MQTLAPWTTTNDEFGGFRTRVCEVDGSGPAVVLLHGFSDQSDTWFPVMELLAQRGQRCVALDLPGAGHADALAPGEALPQFDRFAAAVVDHWTSDGVAPILVGNSLGAAVALRAAQRSKLPRGGLVLISPAGIGYARWVGVFNRLRPLHPVLLTPVVPMPMYRWLAARAFAHFAKGEGTLLPGVARNYAAQFQRNSDVRRVLGPGAQMVAELPAGGRPAMPAVPTLVLWGRRDRMTPAWGAKVFATLSPTVEVEVPDDLGHCPQLERPDFVAGRILQFVRNVIDANSPPVQLVQEGAQAATRSDRSFPHGADSRLGDERPHLAEWRERG